MIWPITYGVYVYTIIYNNVYIIFIFTFDIYNDVLMNYNNDNNTKINIYEILDNYVNLTDIIRRV